MWPVDSPHKYALMWEIFVFFFLAGQAIQQTVEFAWYETPWPSCDVTVISISLDKLTVLVHIQKLKSAFSFASLSLRGKGSRQTAPHSGPYVRPGSNVQHYFFITLVAVTSCCDMGQAKHRGLLCGMGNLPVGMGMLLWQSWQHDNTSLKLFNSVWPSGSIYGFGSLLAQVVTYCLMAPSH